MPKNVTGEIEGQSKGEKMKTKEELFAELYSGEITLWDVATDVLVDIRDLLRPISEYATLMITPTMVMGDPKVELMTGFWPEYDENKEYVRGDTVDSTGKKMGKDWYRFPEWTGHVYTYDPERLVDLESK